MDNFSELIAHSGSKCSNDEWTEYCRMPQVRTNETPGEWKDRIWSRLQYFRDNDLLPTGGREKYLEARRLTQVPSGNIYAPTIGIAICFSCNQLIYTGQMTKYVGNYLHAGMERHWRTSCTGNIYCGVSFEDYLKIKEKSNLGYKYDNEYALHRYELWKCNAIEKLKCAREVGKKIRACIKIQRKVVEWIYHPDGLTVTELALHYACLQNIRAEMRQVSNL